MDYGNSKKKLKEKKCIRKRNLKFNNYKNCLVNNKTS